MLTGGLFLSVLSVNADDVQKAIDYNYLRTPEASAFKKYGEESVNEYTGTADISVPLYTIKCKDIEIPIVLRYDASGIKVEQEASWVGLGWNLMVGGCINYVCAGGHDMHGAPETSTERWTEYLTSKFNVSYTTAWGNTLDDINRRDTQTRYYVYNPADKSNWMSKFPLTPQDYVISYFDDIAEQLNRPGLKNYIDYGWGERDFYSVNVMGKSFMFFVDPATLKIFYIGKAGEDFIVNPEYDQIPKKGIGKQSDVCRWTIKDSDGYVYEFNVGDKYQWDARTGQTYTSCWYLTKIKTPIGETVEFKYSQLPKKGRTTLVESLRLPIPHMACCNGAVETTHEHYTQNENASMNVTIHYLDTIKTSNQTIVFSTTKSNECSGKKLNSIKVRSCDGTQKGTLIKTINLSYSSFEHSKVGGDYNPKAVEYNRLKLDNVKEIASSDTLTTSFSYNSELLPSKRSYAQDYWGYYNGKENKVRNQYTLLPTPRSFMSSYYNKVLDRYTDIGGADRNSDGLYMQAAILNKIVYPTGGYTTYEYEPNRCVVSRSESDMPYDIDIKKIYSYTPDVPAGVNPVSNAPYNFTLKEELDFTLSVKCNGAAIDGQSFNVIIAGGASPKVIPVTYKNSTDFKVVLQDKLPAGSYQLIIAAPTTGTKNYGISCNLTGYYKSSQTQKTYTKSVGGLRVTRINNYDNDGKKINYTEYNYSGGILLNRIETIDYLKCANIDKVGEHNIDIYTINSGHTHLPAFYASCTPGIVGYSKVTKNKFNANGNLVKSVITSYRNNAPQNMYGIDYYDYNSSDNGQIDSQEIHEASNAIVSKTINKYNRYLVDHYATNMIAKNYAISKLGLSGSGGCTFKLDIIDAPNVLPTKTIETNKGASNGSVWIWRYPYILSRSELVKTTTTEYSKDGKTIVRTKDYSYNPKNHQVSQIDENTSLTNQIQRTKIKYTVDDSKHTSIVNKHHRLNDVVETQKILVENGKENRISTQRTDYKDGTYCFSLPNSSSTSVGNAPLETRATYTYDGDCNVRSITIDGKETVYIWSYKSQYPIAKIEGLSFEEILSAIGQIENSQYPKETPTTERGQTEISKIMRETDTSKINTFITTIRKKVNELGGYITTYTYKPLVGILSETQPNGNVIYYEYDSFGRLKNIKDYNKKIIKTYEYHYSDKK